MTKFDRLLELYHRFGLVTENEILEAMRIRGYPINKDTKIKAISARKAYINELRQEYKECIELYVYSVSKKYVFMQRLLNRRAGELKELINKSE